MTKRENFEMIKNLVADNQELVDFINHELELLDKKYSSKGENKVQKENKEILQMLIEVITTIGKPVTISEILLIPQVSEYITVEGKPLSNQKVSRLLNDAVKVNTLNKVVDKKKAYFSI